VEFFGGLEWFGFVNGWDFGEFFDGSFGEIVVLGGVLKI
jgi:hypothetical protein